MNIRVSVFFTLLILITSSVWAGTAEKVEFLRTPNGGIQPQAVVDDQGTLHLIYFKANEDMHPGPKGIGNLFYVNREQGKSGWSEPIRVNSEADSAMRNSAINCAQIAMGENGRIHAVWFNMRPPRYWYTRLKDDASGFEEQRNLVTKYNRGVEAGASVAADGKGNVFVIWHAGKFSDEDKRAIYITRSEDGGLNFGSEERANPDETGVCACCGLNAMTDRNGTLYISYRAAGEKIHRDMTLLKSTDGGKSFFSQTVHQWNLNACPVTTTTLAEGLEGEAMVTWETENQIFFANVENLSEAIPTPGLPGDQKNSAIAVNKEGETLLVWGEGPGWRSGGKLHWQIFDAEGKTTRQKGQLEENMPDFSMPEAVAMSDGSFVVIY